VKPIQSYVSLDLETTGLNPKYERIIEIGAVKVIEGEITDIYSTFVDPQIRIPENITELTGIVDENVVSAPKIDDIIVELINWIGNMPLLGHRIIFDYSFLKKEALKAKIPFEKTGIDTLSLCRMIMPAENSKTLSAACKFYNIDPGNSHRALDDAKAADSLYRVLMESYDNSNSDLFCGKDMIFKVKAQQLASKRQKDHLQKLLNYHKIVETVELCSLSRNEISRMTDNIIRTYGKIN